MAKETATSSAVAFFIEHGQGDPESAWDLARAEAWLMEQAGHTVEWKQDTDYDPDDYDVKGMPEIGWGCIVTVGKGSSSLWAITFDGDGEPFGKPYARVVVAELASELMGN